MRTSSLLFSTFFHFLVVAAFVTALPIVYVVLFSLGALVIAKQLPLILKRDSFVLGITWILLPVTGVMTLINLFYEPIVAFHFFMLTFGVFSATIFTKDPVIYYKSVQYTVFSFQAVLLLYTWHRGLDAFPAIPPFAEMVKGASANGVTSYMIMLQINYAVMRFMLYRKFTFFTSTITLAIAILGYGRGSIICAFLILFASLFVLFASKGPMRLFVYSVVFCVCVAVIGGLYWEQIVYFFEANTKITAGLNDNPREIIRNEYFGALDFWNIIKGAEYSPVIKNEFNSNAHNSFIRGHHIFGLPYLVFLLFFPFVSILRRQSVLEIGFYFILTVTLYFRVFSEPVIFPTIFDFYYFGLYFSIGAFRKISHNTTYAFAQEAK